RRPRESTTAQEQDAPGSANQTDKRPMSDLPHLRLEETAERVPYTFPGTVGAGEFRLPPRDRGPHAQKLKADLERAEADARAMREEQGLEGEGAGEVLAVRSEEDFELKFDSLDRLKSGIELVSVSREGGVTVAKVFVQRGKHVQLLRLIDSYETKETKPGGSRPRNQNLIESIASIKLAALRDFWEDEVRLFPAETDSIWWEVWLRLGGGEASGVHQRFAEMARGFGMQVSKQYVAFPERVVTLAFGTQQQLSRSIGLLALIAELRLAKELPTDYVGASPRTQGELIDELLERLVLPGEAAPAVCILDTGVNREHPLLAPALAAADTQSVKPTEWGTADDQRQHGTGMAGIALYGEGLTEAFASREPIRLRHRLESVKFLPPFPGYNDEKDYGPFTIQAVARAEIQAPERKRALCMAVTADDRDLGMPTLWSAAIDQMCSGALDDGQRLLFISAGNLRDISGAGYIYHRSNCERGGIEDPGQSWNAVTVGAYTERVFIQDPTFQGWQPVAESGDLCPTSRTSLAWPEENQRGWPLKPDIVMEGGNYAERASERVNCPDLSLLTTTMPVNTGRLLEITHDTSPATAAAARMAAVIWSHYPRLEPETVRGLIVHSANWTDAMVRRYPASTRTSVQQRLRCYGYGVPSMSKALWSAENAATLMFEGELQPYEKVGSNIRSDEMHVHRIPWPTTVLEGLGEAEVRMRVTLSYFIEPSPGRIGWTRKHRYQSHGLRFDVNRPVENEEAFRRRLSREEWENPDERPESAAETRNWTIGDHGRRRGSIHSDWWTGTAVELASCDRIAVYPVTGWWRERPHLQRWGRKARYSLIVTIEAPEQEVDLYTPIMNEATIRTEVETD
ncbi:MAG: S8 family peptidase, partial [Candidatus Eisenbacteria bacterium]